ncbi:hypothetical protein [Mycetocola sp.]|uniref:hypothetical protein n=1 Tax=Mycetocola sp. TaxID=1871042 RepID=UPI00398A1F03
MASSKSFVRRPASEGRRRWWIVALGLFLVFDIALVAFALNANSRPTATADRSSVEPASPSTALTPSATPTPSATSTSSVAPVVAVPQRLLAAVNGDVAWRGVVGACSDGSSELEYTADGGATWNVADPAPATGATALVRVVPESSSEANVVTLDAECSPQLVGTFVAGDAWEDYSSNIGSYWYIDPADRAKVHSPGGTVAAPCDSAVAIATRSSSEALVLCANQTLFETTTSGAEWSSAINVPGVVAVAGSEDGYVVAVVAQGECAAASIVALSGETASVPRGCFGEEVTAGQTALAVADDGTMWLWADERIARSDDGGTTWA